MSLCEKYRQMDLDGIIGNDDAVTTIQAHFAQPRANWSHAWLFSGPAGCAKSTLAGILATTYFEVGEFGLIKVNTGNNRGIEAFREILERIKFKPLDGKNWVIWVEEAHGATSDAKDCLLDPLEHAPENVFYVFCTTSPEKLGKGKEGVALLSRMKHIEVKPVKPDLMFRKLRGICKQESKVIPDDVLHYIADACDGSTRKALDSLETVLTLDDPDQMLRVVTTGTAMSGSPEVFDFCKALMNGSLSECRAVLAKLKKDEEDPEGIRRAVLGYFSTVALGGNGRGRRVLEAFMPTTYDSGYPRIVLSTIESFDK